MRQRPTVLLSFVAAASVIVLPGCGGGQKAGFVGAAGRGSATFRITWPDANSRLIPIASQSIKIVVQEFGIGQQKVVATQIVPRPTTGNTSVVQIKDLPVKKLTDLISAYPNANGTGVAQADGTATVDIKKDEDVAVNVTMSSTIVLIELTPPSPATIATGAVLPIVATPRDFGGQQVLIIPNTLQWKSSDTTVATVDATGRVSGVKAGTADVTVTELESTKSATLALTVVASTCSKPSDKIAPKARFNGVPAQFQLGNTYTITFDINSYGHGSVSSFFDIRLPGSNWIVNGQPVTPNSLDVAGHPVYHMNAPPAPVSITYTFTMPSTYPTCYAVIQAYGDFEVVPGAYGTAIFRDVK